MLYERLKEMRQEKGITVQEMAEMIGINERSYRRYEENLRIPRLDTLIYIADILNCSIDYLVGRDCYSNKYKK